MTEEPTVVHRNGVTRRGYYRLEDIPDDKERAEARFAKLNADIADQAMRDHDADKLHAASMAMESHQRNTGWRYMSRTGEYRHKKSNREGNPG